MFKSRRMRWAGDIAHMGEVRNVDKILVGKLEGKRPSGRLCIDGRIILKWVLGKQCWRVS
jgi:hypothetical protein